MSRRSSAIIIDDGGKLGHCSESDASSSSSVPKPDCFYEFTRNGMMKIGEESKDTEYLLTLYMQARFNAFKSCVHAVRERRRDRNFKYGWYGASKQEILHIISYGFSRCNGQSHGVGVYLSTSKFILEMFPSTIEDENGLRHTLFCYVEMGKMELIRAGSKQIYPSSVEFDSGVDNLEDPSRLVVWSAYMNSFILPICILSFKAPSFSIVSLREQINEVRPGGEMLSCAALFPILVKVFGPAKGI
uniref:PARP catalytic domain-containing protein n=1 Tax=Salix viminalis TaxID=40686 RepID=A0A6N2NFI9_SALVM